ncbi:MAG TPA: putative lipid II flippase FtsW [Candidatus Omnitrophota bacterium]|nr:putative lipid II flippase FtsW [Candidatus Omnitrophota bacterium]HPS20021.1 putative lipid II flippase FtsW [Candidatus Omnitrophota bacterium]
MDSNGKIVFVVVTVLVMIGIVMIYSSSGIYAYKAYGDSLFFVKRHLCYLAIGVLAALFFMSIPQKAIRDNSKFMMLFTFALLFAVLIPGIGVQAGGARRWIRIAGLGFQPSEVAKLAVILYLADFSSRKRYIMGRFREGFLPACVVLLMTAGMVVLEPDLGTSVAISFVGFTMLFISGMDARYVTAVLATAIPALWGLILIAPYRIRRMTTFVDPWNDPKGAGFQLVQSFIALGSGGLCGVGLGASKQKLFYLPQSHTDFIYSIIGEELGFLGALTVLLLFVVLIWYSLRVAFKIKDLYMSRVVFGISAMIAFEAIVNMGVSMGALPTKGLPLPFISYGGSSLVVHLAAVGILLNFSRGVE